MVYSNSNLRLWQNTECEKITRVNHVDESVAMIMEVASDSAECIEICLSNEDEDKFLYMNLSEVQCKQLISFLSSHLNTPI